MTRVGSALLPILRSESQARLLAAILLDADRERSLTELARTTGTDIGNAQRLLEPLVRANTIADRRVGRTRLFVPARRWCANH